MNLDGIKNLPRRCKVFEHVQKAAALSVGELPAPARADVLAFLRRKVAVNRRSNFSIWQSRRWRDRTPSLCSYKGNDYPGAGLRPGFVEIRVRLAIAK